MDARESKVSLDPLLTDVDWKNFELQGGEFNLPSSDTKKSTRHSIKCYEENTKQREEDGEKPVEKA